MFSLRGSMHRRNGGEGSARGSDSRARPVEALGLKKGGLQTAPKRKIGPSMPTMGPNGGALQDSRYAAVDESVFVPPSAASQAKADELKKRDQEGRRNSFFGPAAGGGGMFFKPNVGTH